MKRVVTLGEIMLRLSPPDYKRIIQATSLDVVYGGGEANVAIGLSNLGLKSSFVTKLPKHSIGTSAVGHLNAYGVETSHIIRNGERMGIYFLEKGYSMRSSEVIYDRANSAFAKSDPDEYDFAKIFEDADWFHFSGITPALSSSCYDITIKALKEAKRKGITVSCDLNYRKKLWEFEKARKVMTSLMEYVDVCIGVEPLSLLDQFGNDEKDAILKKHTPLEYEKVFALLKQRFGFKYMAANLRKSLSANRDILQGVVSDGTNTFSSGAYEVEIVDRVGGGDAFSAGLIYGLIQNFDLQDVAEFANASFLLKHTIYGDANIVSASEVERFISNNGNTLINR
ncbi:sugar kinase [Niallia sp. NCCP-28]|uniref:sugar kinase n=1 Tax=Niallia sp. NCCP-28 TaxID=2934712 RepID=UPI00207FFE02|nr:sugar kinase [Niallia sp. NCCP-28]GKU82261.1 2-dehydro-3-deoxygluconokinase [Niallia sp. NCCP-28]